MHPSLTVALARAHERELERQAQRRRMLSGAGPGVPGSLGSREYTLPTIREQPPSDRGETDFVDLW
jgi:hypothetical protein